MVVLKVDIIVSLESMTLDRFAEVASTFELAAFKSTCLPTNADEFIVTAVAVELAAAVYPRIVDVPAPAEPPPAKVDVRLAFSNDSVACIVELASITLDRLAVAVETLLDAAL